MGKRVHVIKKHAEYGNYEAFNWKFEEFSDFLGSLGCDMCHQEDVFDEYECDVDEYKTALDLVDNYKKNGRTEEVEIMFDDANADIDTFEEMLEELGGIHYILDAMKAFWRERDKKCSWISFSAW